jgi:isopentenyldiphosphate isomerase
MGFLDRIAACNNADLGSFLPFLVAGVQAGHVHRDFAPALAAFPETFAVARESVALAAGLDTPDRRTAAVEAALRRLAARGVIRGWRGERYPVHPVAGGPALMAMERAAVPHFGVRAYGVHMNGYVRRPDGLHLWVARRAADKPTYPGMLDNTVAGGQPVGIGIKENLVKECAEEAGIPRAMAERAVPVGTISYVFEEEGTLKPDVQYCFDLELPADFTPRNTDGEIAEFMLWPVERVAAVVRDTAAFKFNCNLVIIDFLVRHGVIPPEHPDYLAICRELRR